MPNEEKEVFWQIFESNINKLVEVHTFDGKSYQGTLKSYEKKHGGIYIERVKEVTDNGLKPASGVGISFRGQNVCRVVFLER
ncbi:MAG: hypothetical protein DRO11_07990 [Methanobacteriota archaeon]|nr:MAG: hypothetical protein DRO11_07990 [Euryarchaeota archaeon]